MTFRTGVKMSKGNQSDAKGLNTYVNAIAYFLFWNKFAPAKILFLICLFGVFTVQDSTKYCSILEMKTTIVYAPFAASENIYIKRNLFAIWNRRYWACNFCSSPVLCMWSLANSNSLMCWLVIGLKEPQASKTRGMRWEAIMVSTPLSLSKNLWENRRKEYGIRQAKSPQNRKNLQGPCKKWCTTAAHGCLSVSFSSTH